MNDITLNERMIQDYWSCKRTYDKMRRYYDGKHDIFDNYQKFKNRSNQVIVHNFVNKLISEEVQYSLGNPLSYTSMIQNEDNTINNEIITDIYNNTFHWRDTHNQELMKALEIYGICYTLNYIDKEGRFSEKILTPSEAIAYTDSDNMVQRFIHFYHKKYDDSAYMDIYYPDKIEVYQDSTLIETKEQIFDKIPVSVCKFDNKHDTIFYKIKSLQDGYNRILSDRCNTINDYRNAYLVITGVIIDKEGRESLINDGLINLQDRNATAKWLFKDLPESSFTNALNDLRDDIYAATNHIDGNEKLQSNTSGSALRNRLIFLEQRCTMVTQIVINTVYERIERLFEYLSFVGVEHDIKDVKITATPNIPVDDISVIQALTQLGIGDHISLETALSQLPFIENPLQEIAKIKAEKQANTDPYNDNDFKVGEE